jgi:hypothetical protein
MKNHTCGTALCLASHYVGGVREPCVKPLRHPGRHGDRHGNCFAYDQGRAVDVLRDRPRKDVS